MRKLSLLLALVAASALLCPSPLASQLADAEPLALGQLRSESVGGASIGPTWRSVFMARRWQLLPLVDVGLSYGALLEDESGFVALSATPRLRLWGGAGGWIPDAAVVAAGGYLWSPGESRHRLSMGAELSHTSSAPSLPGTKRFTLVPRLRVHPEMVPGMEVGVEFESGGGGLFRLALYGEQGGGGVSIRIGSRSAPPTREAKQEHAGEKDQ